MKRKILLLILPALLLLFSACAPADTDRDAQQTQAAQQSQSTEQSQSPAAVQTVTPQEAKEIMEQQAAYVLLDVRTAEEYGEGHIKGATLLPYDEIQQKAAALLQDKDAVILVYCRSGRRSAIAAETLSSLGYKSVYDFGGIQSWPYEITTED
jgi:phage shock protein E